jgi:acetoin utilization protein AcuB
MRIKDVMTSNVIAISSDASIAEANRVMTAHRISRLPVVDNGKLVGIVTEKEVESPRKTAELSAWELNRLLEKTPVREIMIENVFTVGPDQDSEAVVAEAQKRKVGSAVVVENNRVVGIVTTDDFFRSIINPILGIGIPGDRLEVTGAVFTSKGPGQLEKLIEVIRKFGYKIHTIHIEGHPEKQEIHDVCFHIFDGPDINKLLAEFRNQGYKVRLRDR